MRGAKQQHQQDKQQQQRSPAVTGRKPTAAGATTAAAAGCGGGRPGGWNAALADVAADPQRCRSAQAIWHVDGQVVGIMDKFPKARRHALLVARQQGLDRAAQLTREHLPLLMHMRQVAVDWIQQQQQDGQQQRQQQELVPAGVPPGWQLGFHSVPSMAQLHLHIISTDFDSQCLKHKKHWNSFTSSFFLHLDDVMMQLQGPQGRLLVDAAAAEQLLKQPLQCHRCGCAQKTMPQLKGHIQQCQGRQ